MALLPRESGKFIAELADHVKIKEDGIKRLGDQIAEDINSDKLSLDHFSQNEFHPKCDDPKALDWIFVVDTLNFCFWHYEQTPGWVVEGKTGYFALCSAINRAVREGCDVLNPQFYSSITSEQVTHVFRGDTDIAIPLLKDRIACLHQVGKVLVEKFDGKFENVVKLAKNSAVSLLKLIVDNFECYRDQAEYKGKTVSLFKRAQILIGDIWACYKNEGIGHFSDIDQVTMFADYRIPQTFLYFNVFEYSNELNDILNLEGALRNGHPMEVEIRGCSIHAVTLLCEYIKNKLNSVKPVNDILIDHFLWDFRRSHAQEILDKKLPFQKVYCIFY